MTATAHALIGGAIAASTPNNPSLGITLAALSHPLLDMIPHWDFGVGWKKKKKFTLFLQSGFDLLLGVILAFIIFGRSTNPVYLLIVIFFSEVWDLFMMPYLIWNWNFPPFSFFYKIQHQLNGKANFFWGMLTQAVTVYGVVWALRFIH